MVKKDMGAVNERNNR